MATKSNQRRQVVGYEWKCHEYNSLHAHMCRPLVVSHLNCVILFIVPPEKTAATRTTNTRREKKLSELIKHVDNINDFLEQCHVKSNWSLSICLYFYARILEHRTPNPRKINTERIREEKPTHAAHERNSMVLIINTVSRAKSTLFFSSLLHPSKSSHTASNGFTYVVSCRVVPCHVSPARISCVVLGSRRENCAPHTDMHPEQSLPMNEKNTAHPPVEMPRTTNATIALSPNVCI